MGIMKLFSIQSCNVLKYIGAQLFYIKLQCSNPF